MPALILYLVKFSCSLTIVWLFYRGILHSLTFYHWNRWYLLGYSLLCFLIPFVNIGPIGKEDPALQPLVIQYIPVIDKPMPATALLLAHHAVPWDPWNACLVLVGLGSFFLLLRFLFRYYSLKRLRQRAVLLREGPVKIFRIHEPVSPFSFGNAIYVNTDQHTEKEWEEIILHEYVHIRQRHTLDILFGELLVIVNWYNPFAWLIRFSIRQNLEFIADRVVIDNGFDKKGYQYHLLKVIGQTQYRLANNFNFSSLKKRIIMMNKMRSARLHLLRFLFILPLLAILLVAFRDRKHADLSSISSRFLSPVIDPPVIAKQSAIPAPAIPTPALLARAIPNTAIPTPAIPTPTILNPAILNPAAHKPARQKSATPQPVKNPPAAADTVPHGHDTLNRGLGRDTSKPDAAKLFPETPRDWSKMLWVVDGVTMPKGWNGADSIPPANIARMSILKDDEATELFGKAGANGVIAVLTKSGQKDHPPLYIVDGTMYESSPAHINPADIASIMVLKNEAAKAQYGEKGRYGVVQITTKHSTRPHVVLETIDSNGKPMTMIADSLYTPAGKIHAENPRPKQ